MIVWTPLLPDEEQQSETMQYSDRATAGMSSVGLWRRRRAIARHGVCGRWHLHHGVTRERGSTVRRRDPTPGDGVGFLRREVRGDVGAVAGSDGEQSVSFQRRRSAGWAGQLVRRGGVQASAQYPYVTVEEIHVQRNPVPCGVKVWKFFDRWSI